MSTQSSAGPAENNFAGNPALSNLTIDSLPVGIVETDARLSITTFNDWAAQITGLAASRALGRTCAEVLKCSGCAAHCRLVKNLCPESPFNRGETTIIDEQGTQIALRINTTARFDQNGALSGAVHAFQDISKLKSSEREKFNFLSMITHDVKSSLSIIGGFNLRIAKKADSLSVKKRRNYCAIITKELRRLESMMDDFLEFSRYQHNGFTPQYHRVNLAQELDYLVRAFKPACEQHRAALKLTLSDPELELEADAESLQRVFINLINNSLIHSPGGSVIKISARSHDGAIIIEFKDGGPGIAPQDLRHIFNPFRQGIASDNKHGFGMGLSVVKKIVEAHGGRVTAASTPGKGTTFTVILPHVRGNAITHTP